MTGARILITGGTGFIGRHVVRKLVERGDRPILLVRDTAKAKQFGDDADIIECDLLERKETAAAVRRLLPEKIVHLAGSISKAGESFAVNLEATKDLLDVAADVGVSAFVLLGSADEYGGQPTPFFESMRPMPITEYARAKALAAEHAQRLFRSRGLPAVVLRVFTAYGFGQPASMFLNQLLRHALLKKHFKMTDGSQRRDLVYIDDVADAVTSSIFTEKAAGRIINIGSGSSVRLADAARLAWKLCGTDPELLDIGGRPKLAGEEYDTEADIGLAAELIGWRPAVSFEAGLAMTIEQMRAA